MKKGDKFIHTDIVGRKYEVTYTGTRRIVKDCEFEFFVDDKGDSCFFTDTEVKKMKKKLQDISIMNIELLTGIDIGLLVGIAVVLGMFLGIAIIAWVENS